jgi:hemerythrin
MAGVRSVGVEAMDEEHEACVAALNELAARRTAGSLRAAAEALRTHFEHEQALLDQHLYAELVSSSGFSAAAGVRKTHYADHARMLASMAAQLRRGGSAVPAAFVRALMTDFREHAEAYDSHYEDELAAALLAASE